MKKILAILALAVSGSVFAGSATLEYQSIDNATGKDQANYNLTVKEGITNWLTGDVQFSQTNNDGNTTSSTRIEGALTGTAPVSSFATFYTRAAVGQKFTATNDFAYYSVEPGVIVPLGLNGLNAKVGYRFRQAFQDGMNDTTRTARVGVSYDLTKKDTVGVRFDRVQGNADQRIWAVNYTRGF